MVENREGIVDNPSDENRNFNEKTLCSAMNISYMLPTKNAK